MPRNGVQRRLHRHAPSDAHNCGSCGHDCGGATCQGGLCQPTTLASSQAAPWGVALDPTNVYWTNTGDGTIKMTSVAGGGPVTGLAATQSDPMSIAVDTTYVYWVAYAKGVAGGGTVAKCAIAGCGGAPTPLTSGQNGPWGIAVDATNAYFTAGTSILKAPFGDAGVATLGTESHIGFPVAVDATSVYWADAIGSVLKCATSGCSGTPTVLGSSAQQGMSSGIAIDATNVYWSNQGAGTIMKVSKTGTGSTTLASAQASPLGVAVDGANVYWTNNTDGTVMRVPIGGGSATTVALGQDRSGGDRGRLGLRLLGEQNGRNHHEGREIAVETHPLSDAICRVSFRGETRRPPKYLDTRYGESKKSGR